MTVERTAVLDADAGAPEAEASGAAPALSRAAALLFAVACGLAVANVYYAQPLLDTIANEFGISHATVGFVITVTQIGYGLGLLLIVPLGDLLNRRRLIVGQSLLSAVALLAVAAAPNSTILLAAIGAVGLLAVVTQVLVAYAATLARPEERGRVVGTVLRQTGRRGRSPLCGMSNRDLRRGCAVFTKGGRQSTECLAGFGVRECRKKHDLGRRKRRKSEPLVDLDRTGRREPGREYGGGKAG